MTLRVLILGGYGTFGGRLARLLADEPRLTLIVAGRSLKQAETFCAAIPSRATLIPAAFDREGDLAAQLGALAPDIMVDASGPFQGYADPYRVVRAAIARGIGYLDLADGSDFVNGIAQFDAAARERGVFVLAGRIELSGAHRGSDAAARARHGARRDDQRRHRAIALCGRGAECHPRDRGLFGKAGETRARRQERSRLRADRIAALHHRAARPRAARQHTLFAGRCAGSASAPHAVARSARHLDGRRSRAGNPASRAECVCVGGAAEAVSLAAAACRPDASRDQYRALGRASRRDVRCGRRRRARTAHASSAHGT